MRSHTMLKFAMGAFLAVSAAFAPTDASARPPPRQVTPSGTGFAGIYGNQPTNSVEFISSPSSIMSSAVSTQAGGSPMAFWETLEHGERVECLACIALVQPLMFNPASAKTREIAAWWLRRRAFGVFGPGEVYEQTLGTLATDPDPLRRAFAATAIGEFFVGAGVASVSQALVADGDAGVRAAAASALGRLNSDGGGVLGRGMADSDATVRLASLGAAGIINSFSTVSAVAGLTVDPSSAVRRKAILVLDGLNVGDSINAVAAAAGTDPDAGVRAEACHALGTFGNKTVFSLLQKLSTSDPDQFVRDEALIALNRI